MNDLNNYMWCKEIHQYNISDTFLRLVAEKHKDEVPWETIVFDEASLNEYTRNVKLAELRKKVAYDGYLLNIPKTSFFVSFDTLDPLELQYKIEYAYDDDCIDWNLHLYDYHMYGNEELRYAWEKYTEEEWGRDCLEAAACEMSTFINGKKSEAFIKWLDQLSIEYPDNPAFQLLISSSLFEHFGYGVIQLIPPPDLKILDEIRNLINQQLIIPQHNLALEYLQRIKY